MVKRTTLLVLFCIGLLGGLGAQNKKKDKNPKESEEAKPAAASSSKFGVATPKSMWELGLHGGYFFISGDIGNQPGYGGGLHFRKSSDYIFSLRGDILFGEANGMNAGKQEDIIIREFKNQWYSGTVLGVVSLNSLRFDKSVRKVNYYAMAGGGVNNFEVKYDMNTRKMDFDRVRERVFAPHITVGVGIAFRVGQRFNFSIEHQASQVLGSRTDILDGYNTEINNTRSVFGDMLNYSRVGINFNIGNTSKLSEPLYWINPLDIVLKDMNEIKSNQKEMVLEDKDDDGVIDLFDKELSTEPDVPVDTKGRTLDSDRDGVADHKDMEPYNPPRPGEVVDANGIITNPSPERIAMSGGGVSENRVIELIDERIDAKLDEKLRTLNLPGGEFSVAEWFLPMIHFNTGSFTIKYADYGTLASIGQMMKGNSQLRLVVTGFTDETGDSEKNESLSYDRAREVIDHLVLYHGIGRGRMILQWQGQQKALVPSESSFVNRRVEFRVAKSEDVEMDPPAGYTVKATGDGY